MITELAYSQQFVIASPRPLSMGGTKQSHWDSSWSLSRTFLGKTEIASPLNKSGARNDTKRCGARNDPSGQIASLTPAMTRQKTEAPLTLPSPR